MRYPTLSRSEANELTLRRFIGEEPDVDALVMWEGDGMRIDTERLSDLAEELRDDLVLFEASPEAADRDLFEDRSSPRLHEVLSTLDPEVLDHPGFWRYLTQHDFWWLVEWREARAVSSKDLAKVGVYVDATRPTECVLMRMFLRGQILEEFGEYPLAGTVPRGTDFWRSHILRVRTGTAPELARAFVKSHGSERMPVDELRPYARRLNRLWTNVVLNVYDPDEADAVIQELRDQPDLS